MMRRRAQYGSRRWASGGVLLVAVLVAGRVCAQSVPPVPRTGTAVPPMPALAAGSTPSVAQSQSPATKIVLPKLPGMPAVEGTKVDRVVAIVNGQLILDSDVDRERRFAALLPYGEGSGPYDRAAAIGRLINRDLILQQLALQPQGEITMQAAAKDLDTLRTSLPMCREFHCETQAGWERFLATEGFTEESLTSLWRQRMEVMAFIEMRFRMGIKISTPEIEEYYAKTLLPQYAAQHVTPPQVRAISSRIEEVLLQEQVSKLLDDWLESLRAQGDVVVRHPGEETP